MSNAVNSGRAAKVNWREDLRCDVALVQRVPSGDEGLLHDARLLTRRSAPPVNKNASAVSCNAALLPDCAQLVRSAAEARERGSEAAYSAAVDRILDFFLADGVRDPATVRRAFRLGAPSAADRENEAAVRRELPFMDRAEVEKMVHEPIDVDALDALREAELARALAAQSISASESEIERN